MLFKVLGVGVGLYAMYAVAVGHVYAKSGVSYQRIDRDGRPRYFWTVIGIYAGLSVALFLVF